MLRLRFVSKYITPQSSKNIFSLRGLSTSIESQNQLITVPSCSADSSKKIACIDDNSSVNLDSILFTPSNKVKYASFIEAWITDFSNNEPIGIAKVNRSVFAAPIRTDILHRVVVYHLAKVRGIVYRNELSRYEMKGSGRKIRPQKGGGRARVSDSKSPIFHKGGKAFPRKTKDFTIKLNKKVQDFGMRSALSSKYAQNQLILVNDLNISSGDNIDSIFERNGWKNYEARSLVVYSNDEKTEGFKSSCKNIESSGYSFIKSVTTEDLTVYDILASDFLILTKEALSKIEARYTIY